MTAHPESAPDGPLKGKIDLFGVEYWLEKGVDPNFESSSSAYTAMDCVLWAEKKSHIDASSAKQLKDMLAAAGGRANKM